MKKFVQFLVVTELSVLFLLSAFVSTFFIENHLLYEDTALLVIQKNETEQTFSSKESAKELSEIAKKNRIELTKVVWESDKKVTFYTNSIHLTKQNSKLQGLHFLANKKGKSENQIGISPWINNTLNVRTFSLEGLQTLGCDGLYYMRELEGGSFPAFQQKIEKRLGVSTTKEGGGLGRLLLLKSLFAEPLLLASVCVLFCLSTFSILFLFIQQSKKISLMKVFGCKKTEQLRESFKPFYPTFPLGIGLGFILTIGYHAFVLKSFYTFLFSEISGILAVTFFIGCLFLLGNFWVNFLRKTPKTHLYLKEKSPTFFLMILSKILTICFIALLPFVANSLKDTLKSLQETLRTNQIWDNAKGVYKLTAQYMGHDIETTRPYEIAIKEYYNANMENLVLFDANNYDTLSSGEPLYSANTQSKEAEYLSANGRCIRINPTFLKWKNILKDDGKNVSEQDFIREDNTLNLLVPITFQKQEEKIKEYFLEDYDFDMEVEKEIYQQDIPNTQPSIHITWIKENQTYFTYNQNIQEKNGNLIQNPIVYVDLGHFNTSYYNGAITQSVFFKAEKGKTGYETLLPSLEKFHVANQIQRVEPIFDQRAKEIEQGKQKAVQFFILLLLVIVTLLIGISSFIFEVSERKKKAISIKLFHGYSLWDILQDYFLLYLSMDIFMLLCACVVQDIQLFPPLLLLLLFIEGGCLWGQRHKFLRGTL